jgi:DNA-binding CsgD family transcriptional regulator
MMTGDPLSPRELEVLSLLSQGRSQREIAKQLHRSINTIAWHRKNILKKLGTRTIATAIHLAVERGLVSSPSPN